MPKRAVILCLLGLSVALLPYPACAAEYVKIENRTNSCAWITLYGILRTYHGREIKLEGPSRPRWIRPNDDSTFGAFPTGVEHVRVQAQFRPPREGCAGTGGETRSYMLNGYGQKHVPNYIFELKGTYPNVRMQ